VRRLEHQRTLLKTAFRRLWARLGRTDPELSAPARVVLRLDDGDLKNSMGVGEPLSLAEWEQVIAQAIQWLGPVPVTLLAHHAADAPELTHLIRFAHRLECPTLLVCDGSGIDEPRAEALLDVGLSAVRVWVGGVSDVIHQAVVGNPGREATLAVQNLVAARDARNADLDIEVAIPWQGPANAEARAIVGWARQVGADGLRIVAPFHAEKLPADPELLDAIVDEIGSFGRTPSATIDEIHAMVARQDGHPGLARAHAPSRRRRFACPVGGQRIVVTANRQIHSCPFKAPVGVWTDELRQTWAGAQDHLRSIAACDRACAHVQLAPESMFGIS
jgi:hypothetical protein